MPRLEEEKCKGKVSVVISSHAVHTNKDSLRDEDYSPEDGKGERGDRSCSLLSRVEKT
jgi:hypothetical protein